MNWLMFLCFFEPKSLSNFKLDKGKDDGINNNDIDSETTVGERDLTDREESEDTSKPGGDPWPGFFCFWIFVCFYQCGNCSQRVCHNAKKDRNISNFGNLPHE